MMSVYANKKKSKVLYLLFSLINWIIQIDCLIFFSSQVKDNEID